MRRLTDAQMILHRIRQRRVYKNDLKARVKRIRDKKSQPEKLNKRDEDNYFHLMHSSAYKTINNATTRTKTNREGKYTLKIPKRFCLYSSPEKVMKIVKEVSDLSDYDHVKSIHIDHSDCVEHDLAAEMLLASAVKSLNTSKPKSFGITGVLPEDEKMSRLLKSVGVVKDIAAAKYHEPDREYLKLYKKRSHPHESSDETDSDLLFGSDRKTNVTTGFTEYLNEVLALISSKLDEEEESKLTRYLSEVLGNAEDHSGQKLWQIVGYLDSLDPENLCCEIVIFNIGKTFFETFKEKTESELVNGKRLKYVEQHNSSMSEELLTLVYAMQQNASSKLDEQIDRGQGTKYFLDLFHHLMDTNKAPHRNPNMFIISGDAILKMDGTYDPSVSEDKLVYAMNPDNDLSKLPDKRYIKSLGGQCFPGAIIYIRYSLQEVNEL
ncbi:hypothetical protein FCV43_19565 [Vibrio genomosp. F6]|uniref:hypothetical protein n=1 Tax=Vibrio genomosp. F6 TaxID=723172 RepID=UPI0010BDA9E5|nr:hypothetical protein [Vibrio genomosp. F6]TKF14484.1 hypothetical protein FCV43_19565 [Vibrio genomosp. F6]